MNNVDKIGIVKIEVSLKKYLDGRKTMKINKISINGVGGIRNLSIDFNEGVNLICGPNGIGKTTILESIFAPFVPRMSNMPALRRNALSREGIINVNIKNNGKEENAKVLIKDIEPNTARGGGIWNNICKDIIFFKTHRDINYISVDSIKKDSQDSEYTIADNQTREGVSSNNIKQWFINRFMWSAHEEGLSYAQKENFELAKSCFSVLDENIKFFKVTPTTYDIKLNTREGEIYYEYLSSGYKSVLHLLLGFIKEIEYRFGDSNILAKDFEGVILIDEIDLHLHPEWQAKLIIALKKMLPKAQIIATTHSPHIIQSVLQNEIIPLAINEYGEIYKKELDLSKYGLQGWTIEEILVHVMGLKNTSSDLYKNTIKEFDVAMDDDNDEKIKETYKMLQEMLHPSNPLRKILEIQTAGLRE